MKEKVSNENGCYKSRKSVDMDILKALSAMGVGHSVQQTYLAYCLRVPIRAISKANYFKKIKEITKDIPVKSI